MVSPQRKIINFLLKVECAANRRNTQALNPQMDVKWLAGTQGGIGVVPPDLKVMIKAG
jgi:hypothetical protein